MLSKNGDNYWILFLPNSKKRIKQFLHHQDNFWRQLSQNTDCVVESDIAVYWTESARGWGHEFLVTFIGSHVLIAKIIRMSCVPFVLLGLVVFLGANAHGQSAKFDTSYVSDKSFLVLRFDIAKLVSMEKMGSKNVEVISKSLQKNMGLALEDMKAITIQFGNKDEGPFENAFSITMEMLKPIDKKKMHEAREIRLERLTETEYGGKTYLKHASNGGPHVFFSNEKTVSWATLQAVKNLIDVDKGKGEMASQIRTAPPGSEVQAAFRANEGFADFLVQMEREFQFLFELPPQVMESIKDAKTGTGSISTGSSTPLYIQLQFESGASAKSIQDELKKAVTFGKASIPLGVGMMKEQLKRLEEEPKNKYRERNIESAKLALKALDEATKLADGVQIEAKQKILTVKIKQMGGIKQWVPIVSDSFAMLFAEMDRDDAFDDIAKDLEAAREDKK